MKRISLLLVMLGCNTSPYAQENASFSLSFNHMALSVKDVNRSAAFYKNVMMLPEITNRSAIEGIRWFTLSDGRELHLISVIKEDVSINKAVHLGLTSNAFDLFVKKLIDLKIPYSDWAGKSNTVNIRADGIQQIFFQDPDGYWLEVNSVGSAASAAQPVKNESWQLEESYVKICKGKRF